MVLQKVEKVINCNETNTTETLQTDISTGIWPCFDKDSFIFVETNHNNTSVEYTENLHQKIKYLDRPNHQPEVCISKNSDEITHLDKLKDSIIQCLLCNESFNSNDDLRHHQLIYHENEYIYQCHRCYETFPLKNDLSRHILTKHSKEFKALTGCSMRNGFVIFSSENRDTIVKSYPQERLATICKILGLEWRKLSKTEQQLYQDVAELQNLKILNNTSYFKPKKSPLHLKKVTAFLLYFSRENIPRRIEYFKEKLYKDIGEWSTSTNIQVKQLYDRRAKEVGEDIISSQHPQVKKLLKCRFIPLENRPLDGFYLYCSLYRYITKLQENLDHSQITSSLRISWNKLSKDYREKYKKIAHQINKICIEDVDYENYSPEDDDALKDLYFAAVEISSTFEECITLNSQELLEISESSQTHIVVNEMQNCNIDDCNDPSEPMNQSDPAEPTDNILDDEVLPLFDFAENIDYNREKNSIKGFSSYKHIADSIDKDVKAPLDLDPLDIITKPSSAGFQQCLLTSDKKHLTGFMLFSWECKKLLLENEPDMLSEVINSSVKSIWKKLTEVEKKEYGSRASNINQENKTMVSMISNPPQPQTLQIKQPFYSCLDCGNIFLGQIKLTEHAKIVHNNTKPYRCLNCFDTLTSPTVLKKHSKLNHSSPQRYSCQNCFATFARKAQFLRHKRVKPCLDIMKDFKNWDMEDKNLQNKESVPSTSKDPLNIVSYDRECLSSVRSILGPDAIPFIDDFNDNLYEEVQEQLNVSVMPVGGEDIIDEVEERETYTDVSSISSNILAPAVLNDSCDNSSPDDLTSLSGVQVFAHPGILETEELKPDIEEYSLQVMSLDDLLVEEYIVKDNLSTHYKKKHAKKKPRILAPWEMRGIPSSCLENHKGNIIEETGADAGDHILLKNSNGIPESLDGIKESTTKELLMLEDAVIDDVEMVEYVSNSSQTDGCLTAYASDVRIDDNNAEQTVEAIDYDATSHSSLPNLSPSAQTCEEFGDINYDIIPEPNPHLIHGESSEGDAMSEGYDDSSTSDNMIHDETFEENCGKNYSFLNPRQYLMQSEAFKYNNTSEIAIKDTSSLGAHNDAYKESTPSTMKNFGHFGMCDDNHKDSIPSPIKSITQFLPCYESSDECIENVNQLAMHGEAFDESLSSSTESMNQFMVYGNKSFTNINHLLMHGETCEESITTSSIDDIDQLMICDKSSEKNLDHFIRAVDMPTCQIGSSGSTVLENVSVSGIREEIFESGGISSVEINGFNADLQAPMEKELEEEVDILQAAIGNVFGLDGFDFSADDDYL